MSSNAVAAVEKPIFVKGKHELASVLKQLEKVSVQAVELIADTMNSTDERVSLKTKLECAKSLLELQLKVSAEISRDQLTRQIAEIKANGLPPPSGSTVPGARQAPRLDLTNIQDVS